MRTICGSIRQNREYERNDRSWFQFRRMQSTAIHLNPFNLGTPVITQLFRAIHNWTLRNFFLLPLYPLDSNVSKCILCTDYLENRIFRCIPQSFQYFEYFSIREFEDWTKIDCFQEVAEDIIEANRNDFFREGNFCY